eukprot:GILI01011461.1.p1 GENE.GILI01011461.1~~GILI01011461.1.p1  ORF type:complete len:329 (-),score=18.11 GILI01011461.1:58-996(-)
MSKAFSFLVCVFYGSTSTVLSFVNKSVLSVYNFNFVFTLLFFQLISAIILCHVLKQSGKISFPNVSLRLLKTCIPLSLVFVLNVSAGFVGLARVNIPIFLCLRRTAVMLVLLMEYFVLGKVASVHIWQAISVSVVGTIIAGLSDLNADFIGYAFVLLNNLFTSLYLTGTSKLSQQTSMNSFGLLFFNAIVSLPLVILCAFMCGEVSSVLRFEYWSDPVFCFTLFISSIVGVVLSYAIFLCSIINSPLATSVTGNIKDIVSTFLGFVLFSDVTPTFQNIFGLLISLSGAAYYSYLKLVEVPGKRKLGPKVFKI